LIMKTLKIKSWLFSLLTMLTVSAFLVSCEQESILSPIEEELAIDINHRNGQEIEYNQLSEQEQADLARFLGWIWGDGKPTDSGSGAKYTAGHSKYNGTVNRLAAITINGNSNPFNFPQGNNLKLLPNIWDYWENALPGGNTGDSQLLRDAIRNPNFLAGLIDGEGFRHHATSADAVKPIDTRYYIDDQTYYPSHPNPENKIYGARYFGPERINQLFLLLGETYGFVNTEMRFEGRGFLYATQRCEALEALRERHKEAKLNNENGGDDKFTVKIFIDPADYATLRGYGYFPTGNYRTPVPDDDGTLNVLSGNLPDILPEVQGTMSFFGGTGLHIMHTETNEYLNADLDLVPFTNDNSISWELVDLGNGYSRIVSLDNSKTKKWLQAWDNGTVKLTGENSTGYKTQWEHIVRSNGSYLLKNRFYEKYLRLGTNLKVRHGASGMPAHWTLEEASNCTP